MNAITAVLFATLLLRDVTVVDVVAGAARPNQTVLVEDGRITEAGPSAKVTAPEGAAVVDGRGKFLIPGLWDMHLHLTIVEKQGVSRDVMLPLLLAHGVTGVRDMGGDLARLSELRGDIASGKLVGPRILTPGPFLDGPQEASPAFVSVTTEAEARAAVRSLKEKRVDFVKAQAGLSEAAYAAVADEARRAGLPLAGHVPEAVSAFTVARSGQRSVEHVSPVLPGDAGLFFACSGQEDELRKELQAIGAESRREGADRQALRARQRALQRRLVTTTSAEKARRLFALMKEKGVRAVPTQIWGKAFAPLSAEDTPADLPYDTVPASMLERWRNRRKQVIAASGPEDFEHRNLLFTRSRELVRDLHRAGVALMAGSDALDGFVLPGISLHQELALFVEAGLTPLEALRTATLEPARYLGEDKTRGAVEKGKAADLVLLDADPLADIAATRRIAGVVLGGRYFSRAELDALLAGAAAAAKGL